jgi:plastocyanin
MRRVRLALPTVLAVVALAAVGCGDGDDQGSATTEAGPTNTVSSETSTRGLPKLIGSVGSREDPHAYKITLTTEDGSEITTTLPPGKYVLEVSDWSTVHNFHLGGPRAAVDVATDLAGTGEKRFVVVFHDWEAYSYVCDAHPTTMNVTFSVHGRIRARK